MLTRFRKRALDSAAELTILSLPDVPLVLVLSHLSVEDLCSAGLAHPRLGALTREHASLWRGKKGDSDEHYFQTVAGLLRLLRVVPPVYKLKCVVQRDSIISAQLESFARFRTDQPTAATTLAVVVPHTGVCVSIIQDVKPQLAHLEISGLQRGLVSFLRIVETARSLAYLEVNLESATVKCFYRWPQALRLPRLQTVKLRSGGEGPDPNVLEVLRSLLRAHSNQLWNLTVDSSQTLPLLASLVFRLQLMRVTVDVGEDPVEGAGLGHMCRLRNLTIVESHDNGVQQVSALLTSCQGGLDRLEIRNCRTKTVRALCGVGLARLTHLALWFGWTSGNLEEKPLELALAGMPNLHSLHILEHRRPRPSEVLSCLPVEVIPKLSLIFFSYSFRDDYNFHPDPLSVSGYLGCQECRYLVRRSLASLHIIASLTFLGPNNCKVQRRVVFFKHSEPEPDAAPCPVCAEVETVVTLRFGRGATIDDRVEVTTDDDNRGR